MIDKGDRSSENACSWCLSCQLTSSLFLPLPFCAQPKFDSLSSSHDVPDGPPRRSSQQDSRKKTKKIYA